MPFADASFGRLLCYDTMHHMHDFHLVFQEFSRVLRPEGRTIFVEPGAKHASSPETIEFLKVMAHDPTWIERDIVLEDINTCARNAGFNELIMVPLPHAGDLIKMPLTVWQAYRNGVPDLRTASAEHLLGTNYDQRVIFFCDQLPQSP